MKLEPQLCACANHFMNPLGRNLKGENFMTTTIAMFMMIMMMLVLKFIMLVLKTMLIDF